MAQKAHPITLRPINAFYQGYTHWNEPRFYYIISRLRRLIESCCLGTTHYLHNIKINRHAAATIIAVDLIHLHMRSKRRIKSRRYKENKLKIKKESWTLVASRLQTAAKLIQVFTGTKKIILKINRLKTYTRSVPKPVRREIAYYTKSFHNSKYNYARYGVQLMSLILTNKANISCLCRFIEQNVCSRQKRKRHYEFLRYLKQGLQSLQKYKKINGLKIQIKGRFTHKAKGRSRTWKCQIGQMPLSQLNTTINAEYKQTQTGYGSVGLKAWTCKNIPYVVTT
uniref:Ribosomal protein S3 n=2 Tax=Sargassum TaxID=3015 RepID=A0A8K1YNV9_9PHAE|nr:ribosomal protein S3 [Sargassum muticum]YP_010381312.1 ribosomal protein S3 [Sargassum kjellmanianum]UVW81846.1 ribosomal protein S3 [Sargassum siliquastrum]AIE46230.1 ribosomal protein S3 [Sargassum muticum]UDH59697.1 ribosomal protein S3 [Sargassum kjellmanianum]UQV81230.1 ribosomal protein S3 [Sargassum muticum]